jgi:starvation-inducible DNA-binding protein
MEPTTGILPAMARKNAGLHPTKNDLSESTRAKVVELLNSTLALAVDLRLQAKQAHWNVKGPTFIALHELFDKVSDALDDATDLLAERAVQLGGTAEGTIQVVGPRTTLPVYPLGASDGRDHVEALSSALAAYGKVVRAAIGEATELGDADTSDIFTEISRDLDKYLWFVEAHLEGKS